MNNEMRINRKVRLKRLIHANSSELSAALCMIVLLIAAAALSEFFWSKNNLASIGTQLSYYGTAAVGCMMVMILGCIDVSQMSVMAVVVMLVGVWNQKGVHIGVILLLSIGVGALAGWINGLLVARFKVFPMIATMGMNFICRALAYLIQASPINVNDPVLKFIGYQKMLGVPILLWIMIAVAAVIWFISRKTIFGRKVYAAGSNSVVAYLSGVKVTQVKRIAYLVSGITAALAGIMWVAQLSSAYPSAGDGFELIPIVSCVIGGISLEGGKGTLAGTVIGVIIMVALSNLMTLMSLSSYYQQLCQGLVLVAVLIIRGIVVDRSQKA